MQSIAPIQWNDYSGINDPELYADLKNRSYLSDLTLLEILDKMISEKNGANYSRIIAKQAPFSYRVAQKIVNNCMVLGSNLCELASSSTESMSPLQAEASRLNSAIVQLEQNQLVALNYYGSPVQSNRVEYKKALSASFGDAYRAQEFRMALHEGDFSKANKLAKSLDGEVYKDYLQLANWVKSYRSSKGWEKPSASDLQWLETYAHDTLAYGNGIARAMYTQFTGKDIHSVVNLRVLDQRESNSDIDELSDKKLGYFRILPNPNAGRFEVQYFLHGHREEGSVIIYSGSGTPIWRQSLVEDQGVLEVDLSDQVSGIYILTLRLANTIMQRERVVIIK
jgi:hypothetical protein